MKTLLCRGLLVLAGLVAGCGKSAELPDVKRYDIQGSVVSVDKEKPSVTLDHKDIPGLMKGMEMEFSVEKAESLVGIAAGDEVTGTLEVRSEDYVITELNKP